MASPHIRPRCPQVVACLIAASLCLTACRRSEGDEPRMASTPAEAAGQIEAAFADAPDTYRQAAADASSALRSGDLTKAVESLGALRASESVTLNQGMAVHSSLVLLEARLVAEADGGDARAQEAYALLRRLKQK
ncbi:MAG: hypothetical protein J0L84_02650 [Verrucomicrobia bacterium]|nr:hypothetical protein [Verrucomicrobiota bacterium]